MLDSISTEMYHRLLGQKTLLFDRLSMRVRSTCIKVTFDVSQQQIGVHIV